MRPAAEAVCLVRLHARLARVLALQGWHELLRRNLINSIDLLLRGISCEQEAAALFLIVHGIDNAFHENGDLGLEGR